MRLTNRFRCGLKRTAATACRRLTFPWALDRHPWRGDETVLDLGTGTGQYLEPLRKRIPNGRIIAGDLAPGMLRDLAARGVPGDAMLLNADAEALPLADGSCEAVLASYVMFFVPDIPRAVAEMSRVLRPGGVLLAATMAAVYMAELQTALNRALNKLGASHETSMGMMSHRFNLSNGLAYLEPRFHVTVHQHESALVFPAAEPVLAYMTSLRSELGDDLPPGRTWEEWMAALREVVDAEIATHGEFRVSKKAGALVATQ
jgi:ubiquinone/menaquinone biosynthesis C-methylase UbiE